MAQEKLLYFDTGDASLRKHVSPGEAKSFPLNVNYSKCSQLSSYYFSPHIDFRRRRFIEAMSYSKILLNNFSKREHILSMKAQKHFSLLCCNFFVTDTLSPVLDKARL